MVQGAKDGGIHVWSSPYAGLKSHWILSKDQWEVSMESDKRQQIWNGDQWTERIHFFRKLQRMEMAGVDWRRPKCGQFMAENDDGDEDYGHSRNNYDNEGMIPQLGPTAWAMRNWATVPASCRRLFVFSCSFRWKISSASFWIAIRSSSAFLSLASRICLSFIYNF